MGGQNVVCAKVLVASDQIEAESATGGRFAFAPRAAVRAGQDIRFAVRRDKIRLEPGQAMASNAMPGKVVNVEYQGTFVKVELATAQADEFVAYLPEADFFAKPLKFGDEVVARWLPQDVCMLVGSNNSSGDALAH